MNLVLRTVAERLASANVTLQFKDSSVFNIIKSSDDYNTVAARIGDTILNEVAIIRNRQKPVYDKLVELVQEQLNETNNLSELADYNVISFKLSDAVKSFASKGIIPKSVQPVNKQVTNVISFEYPGDEALIQMFSYGDDSDLSAQVEQLIQRFSSTELKTIYNNYIAKPDLNTVQYLGSPSDRPNDTDPDVILLAWIALNNLSRQKPAALAQMSDHIYQSELAVFTTTLLNLLSRLVLDSEGRIARDQLVISGNKDTKVIIVQDEVYGKFISMGGTVETLLGMLVLGKTDGANRLLDAINGSSIEYNKAWQDKVNIVRTANIQNEIRKYRVVYSISMGKLISEHISEDIELPQVKNGILKETDDIVGLLNKETLMNVGKTCQILVSRLIFPNTKFEEFTDDMMDIAMASPGISGQDAASAASIRMLIRYLVENLTDTKF